MNKYSINKLIIKNFKLFKEEVVVNFEGSKFIVLDGPNGYGKTTIFDAIEILITGRVNRIVNVEYNEPNKSVLYSNDINASTYIKGEFIDNEGNSIFIERRIEDPETSGNIKKLDDRFDIYILDNLDDDQGVPVGQEYINNLFGFNSDKKMYNLMNYVEQENTLHFLQLNENQRLKEINKLFNIDVAVEEAKKVKKIRERTNALKKEVGGTNGKSGKIGELDKQIKAIKFDSNYESIKYERLVGWKELSWDMDSFEITDKNYNRLFEVLETLKSIKTFQNEFIIDTQNNKYNSYLNDNRNILRALIVLDRYVDRYDEIKKIQNDNNSKKKIVELIINEKYKDIISIDNYKDIVKDAIGEEKLVILIDMVDKLYNLKSSEGQFSELIREINELRNDLLNKYYKSLKENIDESEEICPLCGYDYKLLDKCLSDVIKEKESKFNKMLGDISKEIGDMKSDLKINYFEDIRKIISSAIDRSISPKFISILDKSYSLRGNVEQFKEFCVNENIKFEDFIYSYNDTDEVDLDSIINQRVEGLRKEILSRVLEVSSEYAVNSSRFVGVFKDIFDNSLENLKGLDLEKVNNKKKYFENKFYNAKLIQKEKLEAEKRECIAKYQKLKNLYNKLNDICKIYDNNIKSYSEYMISNLEIPFFILSGKLLQDYQGGLGVFIKSDVKDNGVDVDRIRIKFVNSNESTHDLINKFSSGQLSGLIISFVLATNLVFSQKNLSMILIDDPLHSMDDINMASFVELMRNEFNNVQLIVSTHEDENSRYMRYKFKKYGIEPLKLNMRERYLT